METHKTNEMQREEIKRNAWQSSSFNTNRASYPWVVRISTPLSCKRGSCHFGVNICCTWGGFIFDSVKKARGEKEWKHFWCEWKVFCERVDFNFWLARQILSLIERDSFSFHVITSIAYLEACQSWTSSTNPGPTLSSSCCRAVVAAAADWS